MPDPWLGRPWRLRPNRVSRFYRGGLLLDRFRGQADPRDTDQPEDWIGSATPAWAPPGPAPSDEGLGDADVDGAVRRVGEVLERNPLAVAGSAFGAGGPGDEPTTGILVKLLDAAIRLPVHAHPTRAFARHHLGSGFGKAEAWIVLATREIAGEAPPAVRLGFRRDVGRDELGRWIADERTAALLDALHDRPTRAGDVWFVPPGTPHAIGAGVFILEIQEPTDFSIVLETRGFPIDRADAHLRLGWDVAIDAIDRRGRSTDELEALNGSWTSPGAVLPPPATPFFWAESLVTERSVAPDLPPTFVVGVVTNGRGIVRTEHGELPVRAGDAFAIPAAAVAGTRFEANGRIELIVAGGSRPESVR